VTPETLIMTSVFPPSEGGVQSYILNVARALDPDRTTVLAPPDPRSEEFDRGEPYRIVRLPLRSDHPLSRLPKAAAEWLDGRAVYRAAAPLVAERGVEVVQCAHVLPVGLAALWLKRRFGTRTLIYTHGKEIVRPADYVFGRRMLARTFTGADAVGVVSEYSREKVLELGVPRGRTHKLWTCVDAQRLSPGPRDPDLVAKLGLEGKKVVLSVGRVMERKGFDTIIRALPRVAERVPEVAYVLLGRGPARAALEALAREAGAADRVRFVGYVPDAEMPTYYRLADVFAMVSREMPDGDFEGFGIVYLEASASAVANVAGASGGAAEAVRDGETGLIIEPNDPEAAARALIELLTDDDRRWRMGEAGRAWVLREFTSERRMGEVRALLREIAAGGGRWA
jgi:phosphatidylinositol alpha-1,6-mannosyltransferase